MKKSIRRITMALLLASSTLAIVSCSRDDSNGVVNNDSGTNQFTGTLQRTENGVTAKITKAEERLATNGSVVFLQIQVTNNLQGTTPQGTVYVTIRTTDGQVLSNGGATFLSSSWGGGANVHVMDSVISVPVGKKLDYKSLTVSDIED